MPEDESHVAFREPLKIHFGGQANLFDSGRRQKKAALASAKALLSSLPEVKNLLLAAQKQLLELPFISISWQYSNGLYCRYKYCDLCVFAKLKWGKIFLF